jgi:hypothetical protein
MKSISKTNSSVESAYSELNHFISDDDIAILDMAYPDHDGIQDAETMSELIALYYNCANLIKGCKLAMKQIESTFTYDVVFNDDDAENSKGWHKSYDYCKAYIEANNGKYESYFADYKGGIVAIYCHETSEVVYQEDVK